jgi:hypothetical protein
VRIWPLADGSTYRLSYINGLEFLVEYQKGEIWSTWPDELSQEDAESYLLGPVLGIFLRLRGETCLHASAVAFEDLAVVFVGPPGAGKSTTAAALSCRGYAVLSDDIVLLREREAGRFCVVPSHPFLSLWPESVEIIGRSAESLPRVFPKFEKRRLLLTDSSNRFETRTLPLGGIYLLGCPIEDSAPRVRTLSTQTALMLLVADTYGTYALDGERRAKEFEVLGRLISSVPVRSIHASQETSSLDKFCNLICDDYRRNVPPSRY